MSDMRAGVQFSQERDLVDALKPSIGKLVRGSLECSTGQSVARRPRPIVLEQVWVGMVIPDLVIVDNRLKKTSILPKQAALSHFDSSILAELQKNGSASLDTLSEALFSREVTLCCAIERLERVGFVKQTETGEFSLIQEALPVDIRIISVEAKLRNWKEALAQAQTYLNFSNFSYIALPARVIDYNEAISSACEKEGIGLISVSPGVKHIAVPARPNTSFNQERFWLVSRITSLQTRPRR